MAKGYKSNFFSALSNLITRGKKRNFSSKPRDIAGEI